MKRFLRLAINGFFAVVAACTSMHPEARRIREAREAFNAAIARHDAAAIAPMLLESYHLITGNSAQVHGRDESGERWAVMFRGDPTVIYIRTPRKIDVNERWGLAQETGTWTGSFHAADGLVEVSGVYAAKWQRSPGRQWRLQSEVFTTLSCRGGTVGCKPPDA